MTIENQTEELQNLKVVLSIDAIYRCSLLIGEGCDRHFATSLSELNLCTAAFWTPAATHPDKLSALIHCSLTQAG